MAAIGIANQRETTIVWDRNTGEPIAPAIVWQDRRTADACERLRAEGKAAMIQQATGLELDAYFSATKLAMAARSRRPARAHGRVRGELAFGTVDSWLVFKLTGRHVTDVSNASRTMLFNIHDAALGRRACWRCSTFRAAVLPRGGLQFRSGGPFRCRTGSAQPIPVAGIAGDQQAATFGQACHRPGMVKNTYGTGCFMLMHAGAQPVASRNRLLATVGWRIGGATDYLLEGSVFMGGATVQWLRDGLGIIEKSCDVEELALSVPDNGGVYLVPAFAGLGAPHWDPYARGTLVGMTRGSGRGHIARAALEAIAYQSAELLMAMQKDAGDSGDRSAGRRRRRAQRFADAVPGRPAGRAGGAAEGDRDDGAGRGLAGRPGAGVLGVAGGDRGAVAGGAAVRSGDVGGAARELAGDLGEGGRALARLGCAGQIALTRADQ